MLVGITYGLLPYGHHTMGWTSPWVMARDLRWPGPAGGVLGHRDAGGPPHVPADPVPHPGLHGRQRGQRPGLAEPGWPDVHAHHLAAGHLAAPARLQLQLDPVVGRHLHAAADRRLPGRRAPGRRTWPTATGPAPSPPGAWCWWPSASSSCRPCPSTSATRPSPLCSSSTPSAWVCSSPPTRPAS